MRRFDPDPRLQNIPPKCKKSPKFGAFLVPLDGRVFLANLRVFSAIFLWIREVGRTESGRRFWSHVVGISPAPDMSSPLEITPWLDANERSARMPINKILIA